MSLTHYLESEGVFVYFGINERGVYIVMVEEIRMECHLMRVDKES